MQIVFFSNHLPEDFSSRNSDIFPEPPEHCPFKDCSMPVKMKKHGFYSRNYISKKCTIVLYIRRYICPVCGRTVSMLPSFCLQHFQYSCPDIVNLLYELYKNGIPLKTYVESIREYFPSIERRHINYYKKRVINNRKLIQYGLNLMSPEFTVLGKTPENQVWVKDLLEKVWEIQPSIFHFDFYNNTGKSFMTLQNIVA